MNEKVKAFLEEKRLAERKKYDELKANKLNELGLYEKVYSDKNEYSAEYPFFEYQDNNSSKYYKRVPIEVTDEEFEEIKKYTDTAFEKNPVATVLTVIAWIVYCVGFLAGIIVGGFLESFILVLVYCMVTLVSGTMFLGFAEIIKLLHDIKNKK